MDLATIAADASTILTLGTASIVGVIAWGAICTALSRLFLN